MDHRDKMSWGAPRCQTRGTRGHSGVHQGGRPHRQGWPSWGSVPFPLALQGPPSPTTATSRRGPPGPVFAVFLPSLPLSCPVVVCSSSSTSTSPASLSPSFIPPTPSFSPLVSVCLLLSLSPCLSVSLFISSPLSVGLPLPLTPVLSVSLTDSVSSVSLSPPFYSSLPLLSGSPLPDSGIPVWLNRAGFITPDPARLRGHADVSPMMLISELTFHWGGIRRRRQELPSNQAEPGGPSTQLSVSNAQTLTLPVLMLGPNSCLLLPAPPSDSIQMDKPERRRGLSKPRTGSQSEMAILLALEVGEGQPLPALPSEEVLGALFPLVPLKGVGGDCP